MKRLSFEFRFEIPHHWKCLGLQLATHSEELSAGFDECVELSPCLLITTLKKKKKRRAIRQFQQSSLASVVFH